ncbi:FlgD immunoglobulin-like domain containing protein [Candidatus Eisenbacteria bacterium]|uniref:FlgD immunoglobulin-like domain containing protein n=1 Tax=Eiseniibacteriota bacterium TaxID=2212470 RepID=A0ABV6YJS7_UNCEI
MLIGYTTGTDLDIRDTSDPYYHVTASDYVGNEGEAASLYVDWTGVSDEGDVLPSSYVLHMCQPNPCSGRTEFTFDLPAESKATLLILDVCGRKVATLVNERLNPGSYTVIWDRTDDAGSVVSSGMYYYRLDAGPFSRTRETVVLR